MIEDRLGEISRRIAELKSVERTLTHALKRCKTSRKGCAVLGDLKGRKPTARRNQPAKSNTSIKKF